MKQVAVVATLMSDVIYPYNGERRESFGGVLYNVMALGNIMPANSRIVPVCYVGSDHLRQVKEQHLDACPNIVTDGMMISPNGTDTNKLIYTTPDRRDEQITINTPKTRYEDIFPFLDSDVILFNFINGREVELDTVKKVRENSKALLVMDVHTLCRTMSEGGRLMPGTLDRWEEWAAAVDIFQCNDQEIEYVLDREVKTEEEMIAASKEILAKGPDCVLITLGSKGSMLTYKDGESVYSVKMPIVPERIMADSTGCGDAFSAGFMNEFLKSRNYVKALAMANAVSSLNCEAIGLDGFKAADAAEDRLQEELPELYAKIEGGWKGEPV